MPEGTTTDDNTGQTVTPEIKKLLEIKDQMSAKLDKTSEDLRELLSTQREEIKNHGETSTKTSKALDTIEAKVDQFIDKDFAAIKKEIEDLQIKGARSGLFGASGEELVEVLSPGAAFTKSAQYDAMIESGVPKSSKAELDRSVFAYNQRKDVSRFGTPSGTRLLLPEREEPWIEHRHNTPMIRDFLRVLPTTRDSIQFVRQTGFAPLFAKVATAAAGGATSLVLEYAGGFHAGQVISIAGASVNVTAVDYNTQTLTTDPLPAAVAVGDGVISQTFVMTPETMKKPQADISFELETEIIKTLAHWIPAPRQVLDDIPRLEGMIDNDLMDGLGLVEEWHILYGDGTARQLQGILTHPSRQIHAWSTGQTGDSKIDAIRRALTKVSLAFYQSTGTAVHPLDWEDIELVKGTDRHYIWVTVVEGGVSRLWRTPVTESQSIQQGQAATGAWALAATIWDREQANIRVAEEHAEFFIENMVAILAEERLTVTHERPEAFVEIVFDAPPP